MHGLQRSRAGQHPKESVAEPPSAAATAAGDSGSAGGSCSAEIDDANETAVAARDDSSTVNHSGGNGNAGAGESRLAVAVPSTEETLRAHDPIGGGRYVAFAIYGCVYN